MSKLLSDELIIVETHSDYVETDSRFVNILNHSLREYIKTYSDSFRNLLDWSHFLIGIQFRLCSERLLQILP